MSPKDYYRILDVCEDATAAEIKHAYRKLARKYHPDVSCVDGAEERFKEIVEAYEALKDPCRRDAYDRAGCFGARPPDWERQFREVFAHCDDLDEYAPADLFGLFNRGAGSRSCGRRAHDVAITAHVTLEEAARGTEVELEVPHAASSINGSPREKRKLRVRIPRGTTHGQTIRVPGESHSAATGQPASDVHVTVALKPHAVFRVDGHDLLLDLPLAPWEAALGAALEVPTLDGRVRLRIPAGTPSGRTLRLSGRGLPFPGDGAGDLLVHVRIVTPRVLSERERQLYAELASASTFEPRSHLA